MYALKAVVAFSAVANAIHLRIAEDDPEVDLQRKDETSDADQVAPLQASSYPAPSVIKEVKDIVDSDATPQEKEWYLTRYLASWRAKDSANSAPSKDSAKVTDWSSWKPSSVNLTAWTPDFVRNFRSGATEAPTN